MTLVGLEVCHVNTRWEIPVYLNVGVVGVGGAGDGDPVCGARGAHHGPGRGVAAGDAEGHARVVHCNGDEGGKGQGMR